MMQSFQHWVNTILILCFVSACSSTVKLQSPDKPITINLNVKIEQEVKLKVERDLDQLFQDDKGLF